MIENTQHILDELAKNDQTLADLEKRLEVDRLEARRLDHSPERVFARRVQD